MVESINSGSILFPRQGDQVEDTNRKSGAEAAIRSDSLRNVEPEKTQANSDRVDLSDAARQLANLAQDINGATPESGTIPAERLAEIVQRLHDGYYDNNAVREEIAQRILPDLASDTTE